MREGTVIYIFGEYEFDTQALELRHAGVPVTLAPKVYHVLAYLIQHHNRLVTKDELLEQVWPDAYVDDSAVKHCIMAARRALAERSSTPQYLKMLRGQGYRFVATVREARLPDLTCGRIGHTCSGCCHGGSQDGRPTCRTACP
jgi:DNA-binding winged helix-turn-helix (wHTH) protein